MSKFKNGFSVEGTQGNFNRFQKYLEKLGYKNKYPYPDTSYSSKYITVNWPHNLLNGEYCFALNNGSNGKNGKTLNLNDKNEYKKAMKWAREKEYFSDEDFIEELNKLFKKKGWKELPESNSYDELYGICDNYYLNPIQGSHILYLHRNDFPYLKHIIKFTYKELDNYIVEFIKEMCLDYGIDEIWFMNAGIEEKEQEHNIKIS